MIPAHLNFSLSPMRRKIDGVWHIEKWQTIRGYEGKYMISTFGRVKSIKRKAKMGHGFRLIEEKIIKLVIDHRGYIGVKLKIQGAIGRKNTTFRVHRLVAIAFLPNPQNKPMVNHKWGDKTDNRVNEIEWATSSENTIHAYKKGLMVDNAGEKNGRAKFSENDILEIRRLRSNGTPGTVIAKKFGTHKGYIYNICTKRIWKHI